MIRLITSGKDSYDLNNALEKSSSREKSNNK